MTLIEMEAGNLSIPERAQHSDASDAKNRRLAKAIPRVATIEIVSQRAVVRIVLGRVAVEQKYRNLTSSNARYCVLPRAKGYFSTFDLNLCARIERYKPIVRSPVNSTLMLRSILVQNLEKVALSPEKGDA